MKLSIDLFNIAEEQRVLIDMYIGSRRYHDLNPEETVMQNVAEEVWEMLNSRSKTIVALWKAAE